MLVSKIYIYPHISIPGDLCHFFCFDLCPKILLLDVFYTVFLVIFLEEQVRQMEFSVMFSSNHFIALHLMCLPVEICKQNPV